MITFGVLTISDSCSRGEAVDTSGQGLRELISNVNHWSVKVYDIVSDNQSEIRDILIKWSDDEINVILTTGGTGITSRDVTPEATKAILDKELPGVTHKIMTESIKATPFAALSRLVAGIRRKTVIINFPGSRKASKECFEFVQPIINHAVDLVCDRISQTKSTHREILSCSHEKSDGFNVVDRPRKSEFPMISVEDAQDTIFKEVTEDCRRIRQVSYKDALGKVLANDITAVDPLPPFPASIKDGYAVVASDGAGLRKVAGNSCAGVSPTQQLNVQSGTCVRINTGAPLPPGADAVVQVEDTELIRTTEDGTEEAEIEIKTIPKSGQDIRPIGSDIRSGQTVLTSGTILGAPEIGILATIGVTRVSVIEPPIVSLLSTGNEIQDPSSPLLPGFIRDSNKITLTSLLQDQRVPIIDCGIARDDPKILISKLRTAFFAGDIVVTTGAVSMGDKDLLRQVLVQHFKAKIHFARVHMKPGKPTTFATVLWPMEDHNDGCETKTTTTTKMVLGLPGNPVSAVVTSHLFLLPLVRKMSGRTTLKPAVIKAIVPSTIRLDLRPEFQRVIVSFRSERAEAELMLTGNQISSRLLSLSGGVNGLMRLPGRTENKKEIERGSTVDVLIIGDLYN